MPPSSRTTTTPSPTAVGAKYGADLRVHDGPGDHRVVVTIEPTQSHAVHMSR